ncbi:lipopolysaccharide biosynthesis protein [Chroococcidiopsis sp.]|uniref:lipopolysaccharide biosynthesis protein n=1 Tax=Chroococcidiopsis sp. TaxID=3088168 RepID=UPI003F3135F7
MPEPLPESLKTSSEQSDRDRHFRTDHLNADLKKRSVRGGAVTLVAQACKFTLQIGSTVILARLLAPQDYGLVGMVTAVTGFVALFKDMGLSMATIQKAEINHQQISNLFWVNIAVSLLLTLVTCAIAPVVAVFYNEPRLTLITVVSAIGFLFGGLTVQHQALLNRQMRFTALAAIDIVAMGFGVVSALVLARYGAGYWALVVMQIAIAIGQMGGAWLLCSWRPSLPQRHANIRELLTFGSHLTGFNVINYFARNLDNILIGRSWGAGQLGLYSKAYGLLLLPLQQINAPITAVAIPSLSRLQADPQQFRNYYLKAVSLVMFLTLPLVILSIAISEEVVTLILGSQWREASFLFRFLGVAAIFQPLCNTAGWLYIATGKTDRMLKWGVFASSLTVVSFFIGLPYGARGVALCYAVAMLLQVYPCMYYATRGLEITTRELFSAIAQSLVAALIAGIATIGVKFALDSILPVWGIAIACTLVMAGLYVAIVFYLFGKKSFYLSFLKEFKRR